MNKYINKQDMLNAVEKLDIIPSVDGMGIPTDTEDFRVQFLGTVLKVEPVDVVPVDVIIRFIGTRKQLHSSPAWYEFAIVKELDEIKRFVKKMDREEWVG